MKEWLIFWVSIWKIWFRVGVSEQAHTGLESWFCLLAQVLGFLSHSPNHSDHFSFAKSSFNSSLAALWDILEISGHWSTWELSGTSLVLTAAMFSFYSMFDEFIHLGWKFCFRISKVCCCRLASVAAEVDAIRNPTYACLFLWKLQGICAFFGVIKYYNGVFNFGSFFFHCARH